MDSLFNTELCAEDIEILINDCNEEIVRTKADLNYLMIKRGELTRKLKQWRSEREYLEILRSGVTFDEFLTTAPYDTLKTIRAHYEKMAKRLKELEP